MRQILLIIIKFYQIVISPLIGQRCRFYPSCSHYAHDAVKFHGVFKGSWLAVKRLGKCHPWHEGGYDPVPLASKLTTPYSGSMSKEQTLASSKLENATNEIKPEFKIKNIIKLKENH